MTQGVAEIVVLTGQYGPGSGSAILTGPLWWSVRTFSTGLMDRLALSVFDVSSPLLARREGWPYLTEERWEALCKNGITLILRMGTWLDLAY